MRFFTPLVLFATVATSALYFSTVSATPLSTVANTDVDPLADFRSPPFVGQLHRPARILPAKRSGFPHGTTVGGRPNGRPTSSLAVVDSE